MNTGRHVPDHDDDARRDQDEEIDLRYRAYRAEEDPTDEYELEDNRVADGWYTEPKSETAWWAKAGIAVVSILIVLGLVAGLAGPFLGNFGSNDPPQIEYVPATVVEVVDMRTIIVDIEGEIATVRYIGVDPLPLNSPWYDVAQLANQQLVTNREVLLEADETDEDDFGRLLRYVYVDRNMVNGLLIRNGIALPGDSIDGLNRHFASLQAWSDAAKFEKLGHWSGLPPQFSNDGGES
ncbi:MAG: thermonuclease family protein [Chloroflexi bacterium]|nr:thermonuclease family protein [Chloroflexota bacterium]